MIVYLKNKKVYLIWLWTVLCQLLITCVIKLANLFWVRKSNFLVKFMRETFVELANPCIWKDLEETNVEMDACEEKVKAIGEKYHNNLPEKTDLCRYVLKIN